MSAKCCGIYSGNTLDFKVEGQTAFEIPLGNVSRSITAKNEVTIEFTPNDDAAVSLVELRFHVPSDTTSVVDPVDVSATYFLDHGYCTMSQKRPTFGLL